MTRLSRLLASATLLGCLCAGEAAVAPTRASADAVTIAGVADPMPGDGNYPAFSRELLADGNVVTWAIVDPAQIDLFAATAAGHGCAGGKPAGLSCGQTVGEIAQASYAAGGMGGNVTDYIAPEGLVVVDHTEMAPAIAATTSLCVGDRPGTGRTAVSISKTASAALCRYAVSGQRLVDTNKVAIEGLTDAGDRTKFWWSVKPHDAVERQLVGTLADGRVLLAVASSATAALRGGMTLPAAARFLIDHGATNAIALDGGHLASLYETHRGDIIPVEAGTGVPKVKVALLFKPRIWSIALAPPPPPPSRRLRVSAF